MPDQHWTKMHAGVLLLGAAGLFWGTSFSVLLLLAALSFTGYLITNVPRWSHLVPLGGYANIVTLSRLLLLIITASQYSVWHDYLLFLGFLAVIVSDGIDGYLARKYGQETTFGANLDIETDALMCALLSGIHYLQGTAGEWVILVGFLRYFYVWTVALTGLEKAESGHQPYARLIGVLFICSLMGPFVAPIWLAWPVLVLGSILVTLSFGLSFYYKVTGKSRPRS